MPKGRYGPSRWHPKGIPEVVHRPHCTLYSARLQVYSILHAVPHSFSADSHDKMIAEGAQSFIAKLLMFSLELCFWTGDQRPPPAYQQASLITTAQNEVSVASKDWPSAAHRNVALVHKVRDRKSSVSQDVYEHVCGLWVLPKDGVPGF